MINKQESIIITTLSRLLVPFIQLFALYVIMHGHSSPGGGFQGGVILGASFILLGVSYGMDEVKKRFSLRTLTIMTSVGVFIYGGIGFLCFLLGANFLDYGVLPIEWETRGMGMLGIEIGVGITVMAVMVSIYQDLVTFE
jgi:multicomponent Na+:H+ antiporter subunit B